MFHCGNKTCEEEIFAKRKAYGRWSAGLCATYGKMRPNKCDNCFKLTGDVHRCGKCLTKSYCSKACQLKDWEKKHQKLCKNGAEEWKVKGGSEAREKAGLENLADGFQKNLELSASRPGDRKVLTEVKEVFEKKESTVKGRRGGGEKSHGGGKKSHGSGKKSHAGGKKSHA